MSHILLSFELLIYTLLQQTNPFESINVSDSPLDCHLKLSAYHPYFALHGSDPLPLLSIQLELHDNELQLRLKAQTATHTITANNGPHYSLLVDSHHPLLCLIPLSAFKTPLYAPHTLSLHQTHQLLSNALPHIPTSWISQWRQQLTFNPPSLDWPDYGDPISTQFTFSYQLPSPGPTSSNTTPHTAYIYYDGTDPTQRPTPSFHSIYRHFLLDLLLTALPLEWILVRVHSLTPIARYPVVQLIPLAPFCIHKHPSPSATSSAANTPHPLPAVQYQMAGSAFNGALLHITHPAAQELTDPTLNPTDHPGYPLKELPLLPLADLYTLLDYSDTDHPPIPPNDWINKTLHLLSTRATFFNLQQLGC